MTAKINQKEYLKKYLSGDKKKKKKKKDKKLKNKATVKIIDDDVHVNQDLEIDEELLLTGDDAPQIVGIVNASGEPAESKWKSFGGIKKEEESDDLWGKKAVDEQKHSLRKDNHLFPVRRNSDQSPPRRGRARSKHTNGHNSPYEKRPGMSSQLDQSPPRKTTIKDLDNSPIRKHSSGRVRRDSDQSPPRRRSPVRSKKDSDKSPPKRDRKTHSRWDSNQSPRRRRSPDTKRSDSDQSPRRRKSPGRKRRSPDQSPPRRKTSDRCSSSRFDNSSGIRIKRENSADQSPPRQGNNGNPFKTSIKIENPSPNCSPRNRTSESPPPTHKPSSKMSKTLDGKRAGLQNAQTLRIETEERRRNEDRMYSKMSKEISGRDAEVQVRKSSYRRQRRKDIEEDPEVQRQKAEHEEKKKELYSRWNKGVKQIEAFQTKMSDDQYEASKPLARYSNDADLDEMLRQKEREDDPMLAYIRGKKKDQQLAANVPVMPKYKGSYPENRFGIPPGYRWDGVDRSNGYEKKWFDVQSSKEAVAEEAYKYSVEDM